MDTDVNITFQCFLNNTFDNIGYFYDLYKGENKVKKCECCGTPIKVIGKYKKYCDECFKDHRKKYIRNKVQQHRNKQNVNN